MSFDPGYVNKPIEFVIPSLAHASVVKTIVDGSGGPDNNEMTAPGLRFVRYLLATSRSARHGFVPNFKNMSTIELLAREFIGRCGGPFYAVETMIQITSSHES